jgi:PPE-SVP subfamily C-terminal region/PE family
MPGLTTLPEELLAAQAALQGILTNLAAQNAGAAGATTVIAPAAADPISAQQAGIFSTYGTMYQQIAAEAHALQEQYASNLGVSSNSYSTTEATNAANNVLSNSSLISNAPTTPFSNPLDIFQWLLGGTGNYSTGLGGPFSLSGNGANLFNIGTGNWASAASDLLGMAGGGLLDTSVGDAAAGADLAGTTAPAVAPVGGMAGMAGMGAMPMAAGVGQATMVGKLSVPPSWAGSVTSVAGTSALPVETVGWTGAAPQAGPGTIVPGMPGMGAAARNSAGFGAPRYGVKPIVMPKPTAV